MMKLVKTIVLLCFLLLGENLFFAQCTPGPTASFTSNFVANQCATRPVTFSNTSTGNNLSFEWDFGNPASGLDNTSNQLNPIHTFVSNGGATEDFTIRLIAIDDQGCRDTVTQTLTIRQTPGANLIDPNNGFRNCDGGSFDITVFDFTPTFPPDVTNYTVIWGDGSPNFSDPNFPGMGLNHTYNTVEVFNMIYITQGANGCSDSLELAIGNITNPSIGAANPGGTTGCADLTICFPLNNYESNHPTTLYIVDYGDGSPIDTLSHPPPSELCHTYTEPSCGTPGNAFTFRITAENFCDVSEASITPIRVFRVPIASFSAPTPACANSPTLFTNTTAPGFNNQCSPFTQVNWDWGDGTPPTTQNIIGSTTHTFTNPGTYTVTLSTTNSCGTTTATQEVCVESPPDPDFTISPASGCAPLQVTTTNNTVLGATCSVTNSWSTSFVQATCQPTTGTRNFINGTDANSNDPELEFSTPGVYSLTLSMSNSCGNFSHTENISVQGPPEISINPINSICGGESISPTAVFNDCDANITSQTWSFPGGNTASSNLPVPGAITYPTNGSYTVSLSATNACGTDTDTRDFTVNSVPPELNPFTVSPLCEGYDALFTSDNVPNATYNWTGPNGFTSNQQNPVITSVTAANAGTYSVYASFGTCEGATQTVDLTILPITIVDAGANFTSCIDAVPFTINTATPIGGTWSGNGVNAAGLFDPASAGVGAHTLTYTYIDPVTNCEYSDVLTATVFGLPIVNAGPDLSLCNQAVGVPLTPVTPLNGSWSGIGVSDPNGEFTPFGVGTFEIYYSFTDGNGCFNEDTVEVNVVDATAADAGQDEEICENGVNIQLTGAPVGGTWIGTGVTPGGIFDPTVVGTFQMTYSVGAGSCLTTDVMEITVLAPPNVDAGSDLTICLDGGEVDLSNQPNLTPGIWSGPGITDPIGTFDPLNSGEGNFTLTYTYTDNVTTCSNTDQITANVNPLPVVNAGQDTTLCNQPLPVQFTGLPAGGVWSGPDVTNAGEFTPNGVGVFTLFYSFLQGDCSAYDSIIVTVVDPANSDAGLDFEICFQNNPIQLNGTPANGSWTGHTIATDGTYTPNIPGTYELVYSFGAGNCLTRDTMEIIVHELPVVQVGIDQEFCISDAAVNFTSSPAGGTWSGIGIVDVNVGTFDPGIGFNNEQLNEIIYSFTDNNSCTNTDTLQTLVHPLPTVLFDFNPIVCVGVNEQFTNNSLIGNDFVWDFGDNTITSTLVNPSHTYNSTGTFDIQLIATSIFGCIDSLSQSIVVREPPTADFSILPDSGCGPLQVAFTNNSQGLGTLDFVWDFGNGNTSTQQNPGNQSYLAGVIRDTSYTVTLEVTNFCGSVSTQENIVVMPNPTANFGTLFDEGCSPFTVDFANISLGLPDNSFWDFGNGLTSTTTDSLFSQVFVTGTQDTTFTVTLIVENECGSDTISRDIHILPQSVNAFFNTSVTNGCAPLTVDFESFSAGATNFNWAFGDGNVSNQGLTSNTYTDAGTYNVRLIVNDNCSRDTATIEITVHPQPELDFEFTPNTACTNIPFLFSNQSNDVSSFSWDFGDGQSSSLTNPSHAYANSGTYQVTLSGISTVFLCETSITKDLVVIPSPDAQLTINPNNGCVPLTTFLTNNSINFSFINWDFGDGNFSNQANPSHTYSNVGNYTVKVVVENNIGCKDSISEVIQVFPIPSADFDLATIDSCAIPAQVQFTNNSIGATSFQWNFGNAVTSNLTHPNVFYDNPSTYFVKLVAINQYNCRDSIIKPLNIYRPPVADLTISGNSFCRGEYLVANSLSSNATNLTWYMGDGEVLTGQSVLYTYEQEGFYNITLVAEGDGGCTDTVFFNQQIEVKQTPYADFESINFVEGESNDGTIQFVNLSSNAHNYLWFLTPDSTSTLVNPIYDYGNFGNYFVTLIARNDNGCEDTITKMIEVDFFYGLHVPNAMDPSHPDYEVSHFLPKGVGIAEYQLLIYDDWGNLIFESTALDEYGRPSEAWDGTFNGKPVQQDAYVWKINATFRNAKKWEGKEYPNAKTKRAGTVTVIR